jgi:phosphatidylglycerophosphate synthase
MTLPETTDLRAPKSAQVLACWSRGQAIVQLGALVACAHASLAWPVLPCSLISFGALLWLSRAAYTPSGRFGWANGVTLLRLGALLTLTLPLQVGSETWVLAVACSVLGLDLLDGSLARARGDASAFGAHFDMECDAQLVLVLTLYLWLGRGMGGWVLCAGTLRYLYVIWLWVWPGPGHEAPRSLFARSAFALLMIGLCGGLALRPPWSSASVLCGTLVVVGSFARSCYYSLRSAASD